MFCASVGVVKMCKKAATSTRESMVYICVRIQWGQSTYTGFMKSINLAFGDTMQPVNPTILWTVTAQGMFSFHLAKRFDSIDFIPTKFQIEANWNNPLTVSRFRPCLLLRGSYTACLHFDVLSRPMCTFRACANTTKFLTVQTVLDPENPEIYLVLRCCNMGNQRLISTIHSFTTFHVQAEPVFF